MGEGLEVRKGSWCGVPCEHPLAALTGIRMLGRGGKAADACVTMPTPLRTRSDNDRHGQRRLLPIAKSAKRLGRLR